MEKHPRFDALIRAGKVFIEHLSMRLFGQKCEKATWLYSGHDFLQDASRSAFNSRGKLDHWVRGVGQ